MVHVPLHGLDPLPREPRRVVFVVEIRVRHLARHQEPHLVGPVQEPRILQLLVLPGPVEPHVHCHFDVVLHRRVRRRRDRRLHPIPLIEHHLQIRRPPVQMKPPVLDQNRPVAVIRAHPVQHLRPLPQFELDVVQVPLPDPPLHRIVHEQPQVPPLAHQRHRPRRHHPVPILDRRRQRQSRRRPRHLHVERHVPVHHRRRPQLVQIRRPRRLHPDRLPDPRRPRIENPPALRLPILLPARDVAVLRRILRPHHDHLRPARRQEIGHVDLERHVPALVLARQPPVHPDHRPVVHRAEVQQHPPPRPARRRRHRPPVPHPRVERRVPDPRQLRLERVRDGDLLRKRPLRRRPVLFQPDVGVVELKLPFPVQRLPVRPRELRLRYLRARHRGP